MKQTQTVRPAQLDGSLSAPASKSDMQRAVAAAYLTGQDVEIRHPSFCDDGNAALGVVKALGAQLDINPECVRMKPGEPVHNPTLDCGESGLSLRMFSAIASLRADDVTLTGRGGLPLRPISMIEEPLRELGVTCRTKNGFLPVTLNGPLQAGRIEIDGSVTSQFLTGLLMALPLCDGDSEILVKDLKSRPYVEMTLNLLEKFSISIEHENFERFLIKGAQQYRSQRYDVEGDWSGASFPLVAGAIAGHVRVENLDPQSLQADRAIVDVLRRCCAEFQIGENFVDVRARKLSAFDFDATDCPDLFPPLVALASYCHGKSVIHGAQRLKVKESDRGQALLSEFRKMGASIELYSDRIEVLGGTLLDGGTVDSYNDHRIAMACAVAALGSRKGVTIEGAECVTKSYPEFFDELEQLMA